MLPRRRNISVIMTCCSGLFLLVLLICGCGLDSEDYTIVSEGARPTETTKNYLLRGAWVVDSLEVPTCELCEENYFELNKMMSNKIKINDTLLFTRDSMFHKSGSTLLCSERFKYKDSELELIGYDWVYGMTIRTFVPDTFSLAILQRYVSPMDSNEGPKYLVAQLVRLR
jgi:hypothetical protein